MKNVRKADFGLPWNLFRNIPWDTVLERRVVQEG